MKKCIEGVMGPLLGVACKDPSISLSLFGPQIPNSGLLAKAQQDHEGKGEHFAW